MIKRKAKKDGFVRVCPSCKSVDVRFDKTNPLTSAMGLPAVYVCGACGHTGSFFPEVPLSELSSFEGEVDKKRARIRTDRSVKVDVSYGEFAVHVMWKVLSPLILFLGTIFLLRTDWYAAIVFLLLGIIVLYVTYVKKYHLHD